MHHSEQKCAHFCSEWCIVGYETGALWDLQIRSIILQDDHKHPSNNSLVLCTEIRSRGKILDAISRKTCSWARRLIIIMATLRTGRTCSCTGLSWYEPDAISMTSVIRIQRTRFERTKNSIGFFVFSLRKHSLSCFLLIGILSLQRLATAGLGHGFIITSACLLTP